VRGAGSKVAASRAGPLIDQGAITTAARKESPAYELILAHHTSRAETQATYAGPLDLSQDLTATSSVAVAIEKLARD